MGRYTLPCAADLRTVLLILPRTARLHRGECRWPSPPRTVPAADSARSVPSLAPPPVPRARRALTAEQRHLADRLHPRADTLRATAAADADDPGLNICDGVDLAAVQLCLQAPTADWVWMPARAPGEGSCRFGAVARAGAPSR